MSSPGGGPAAKPALLGLSGEVTTEHWRRCWRAADPTSGTRLGNPLLDRVTKSGKVARAVAGFDATFSAPKSLSVWWALTGDDGLAECHDVAVAAVVDVSRTLRIHDPDPIERPPAAPRQARTDRWRCSARPRHGWMIRSCTPMS